MSARAFEEFLTRIYVDPVARARFKANPLVEARNAGLSDEDCASLEHADWVGLEMAARSFSHKRQLKLKSADSWSFKNRLLRFSKVFFRRLRSIR